MFISILDYNTGFSLIIEDEEDVVRGMSNEEVEAMLEQSGLVSNYFSCMVTEEKPETHITSLRDMLDENYDEVKNKSGNVNGASAHK